MAQSRLKMAVFDPVFGHTKPPMPGFETPSGETVPFDMCINMQKQWLDFETVCWKEDFPRVWYLIENYSFVIPLDMEAM